MTNSLLVQLLLLFGTVFIVGTIVCLPLYGMSFTRLRHSQIWTKILTWIPIMIVFIALLYGHFVASLLVVIVIFISVYNEFSRQKPIRPWWLVCYPLLVAISMTHLLAYWSFDLTVALTLLITVAVCSVLSDATAYFFGNYLGKHKLPTWINPGKSWEGVLGQLIGAAIGAGLIVMLIHITISPLLILIIGLSSALGDLINSFVKRRFAIKDWGNALPGHGGVLDRLSSMSLALLCGYWATVFGIVS